MLINISDWEKRNRRKELSTHEIVEGISKKITLFSQIVTLSIEDSWYVVGLRTQYARLAWEDAVFFEPVNSDELLQIIRRQGFNVWEKRDAVNKDGFLYVTGRYDISGRAGLMAEQGFYMRRY